MLNIKTGDCLASLPPWSAVGCFSAYNLEILKAIILGAEKAGRPAIISLDPYPDFVDFEYMTWCALVSAKKASVPIAVHLNHGRSMEIIQQALQSGLLSVMFDGSRLPYEDNIRLTSQAKIMAHEAGAEIEGEFGPLCTREEELVRVFDFLNRTGIDILAFSVGKDQLRSDQIKGIELLAVISQKTGLPLVLHGASRLPDFLLKQAICSGVRKINVHTDLLHALKNSLLREMKQDVTNDPLVWLSKAAKDIQLLVEQRIRFFAAPV